MVAPRKFSLLVVTLSNIGDGVLTTPVIARLRALFPSARMTVVAGPKVASLLEGSRQIDRLLVYDKRAGWAHKLKLVRQLREDFYDLVVDLRNSAIPYLVRAEHRSPVVRFHRKLRARERHLEVLEMTRLPAPAAPGISEEPRFDFFSKEEAMALEGKLKSAGESLSGNWIVAAPGAGSEAKRWRIDGFSEVVRRLLEDPSVSVAVVGDAGEASLGETLCGAGPKRVVNLAGKISLRQTAALISDARLVLTNDSAVMHLAHELGRPVVALFGPTDPEVYGRESPIWKILSKTPPASFQEITADEVFTACREVLEQSV